MTYTRLLWISPIDILVLRPFSIIGGIYSEAEWDAMPNKRRKTNPLVTDDEQSFEVAATGCHLLNNRTIGIRLHGTHNKLGMNIGSMI